MAYNFEKISSDGFTFGTTNIENIMKNPENYEGKFVTIKGEFGTSLDGTHFLIDNEGFNMRFKPEIQRTFNIVNRNIKTFRITQKTILPINPSNLYFSVLI